MIRAITTSTSDIILVWIAEDAYSLSEAGWTRPQDQQFHFEVTAEQGGHRHIERAPSRESAVVDPGALAGYPLDE